MKKIKIQTVDAFTSEPFSGNPAAVCLLEQFLPAETMQNIATEMNLSETAFLMPKDAGFNLRWFTPAVEVDLCGHATLASAHFLWENNVVPGEKTIVFDTLSGELKAAKNDGWITLDFPSEPPKLKPAPEELLRAMNLEEVRSFGENRFDAIIEVASESMVRATTPNMSLLENLPYRGVILTAQADSSEFDFISRFFAPAAGVPEDPVTGSAHCCLAPFWGEKLGKTKMTGFQASRRGGVVRVENHKARTLLRGQAVTVTRVEMKF